ncbi:MAG: heavy metal translocating P-type ATPase metal-binding domain-containing protein [Ignavibacteria bacterium]|nr:heavy metal translocating P-type ATPase metal-binding domain-containing protein [Ignavibacteria bacterium]
MKEAKATVKTECYHCGEPCSTTDIALAEKVFCCEGCRMVFQLLNENGLCNYYTMESNPGISKKNSPEAKKFDFLDDESVTTRLLTFNSPEFAKTLLFIPSIHCSSCIWLLENLHRLNPGVIQSSVNFPERKVSVTFSPSRTSLKEIAVLLTAIGYEPKLSFEDLESTRENSFQKSLYYKVGIAGFAFGNIMLLSFPEYLAIDASSQALKTIFGWLIILLSLPVFFYCSSGYFTSAYKSLRSKAINIDLPLALGILAFYSRSLFEILSRTGPGYMDSFAGLIFFLLIGKIFQNKTFDLLNFERNYRSYFPIAVTVKKEGIESSVPLSKVSIGDRLIIRNNELIPVDSVLVSGAAHIDYSFITGESELIQKQIGDLIYAGGRQAGNSIEVVTSKNVSQSYLTQLWNDSALNKKLKGQMATFSGKVSKYFTMVLLAIAFGALVFWSFTSLSEGLRAFSAVLIIACPCALALSTPFALGNTLRILSRNNLYLKNTTVVESLTKITHIIFDKTGTITRHKQGIITFEGATLSQTEMSLIKSLTYNSTHPLSKQIYHSFSGSAALPATLFTETEGAGIEGFIDNRYIKCGSMKFIQATLNESTFIEAPENSDISSVYVSIDNIYRGRFLIHNLYREGTDSLFAKLRATYTLSILSGDSPREAARLQELTGNEVDMRFNQSPYDKLSRVQDLQKVNQKVLMIGDGLNDSGALLQSNVGISVSEDILNFTPASDGIMEASALASLPAILQFAADSVLAIKISFAVSALYNIFGLYYAVTGLITPLFAAVLMPISSVTVIGLTVSLTTFFARRRGLRL